MMESEISFEKAIEKLQEIVKKMEGGEMTLEESIRSFEEGISLSRICQEKITAAEKKIEILTKVNADGTVETKDFGKKET